MFRMSVSTGQLDIGIQDAEFKNESDKRKSKKKRTFPSASQLLSRYDGPEVIKPKPGTSYVD